MPLSYNCTDQGENAFLGIIPGIMNFIRNSTDNSVRLIFKDCHLTMNNIEYFISLMLDAILEKADSCKKSYLAQLEFVNRENNNAIGLDALEFIIRSAYELANKFNEKCSYGVNFVTYFDKNGVTKALAEQLLQSCKNVKVFYDPESFLGQKIVTGEEYATGPVINNFYDPNKFYTIISSTVPRDSECIFTQVFGSSMEHYYAAVLNPMAPLLAILGTFGAFKLVKCVYNKFFASEHSSDVIDNTLALEAVYLNLPESECVGEDSGI